MKLIVLAGALSALSGCAHAHHAGLEAPRRGFAPSARPMSISASTFSDPYAMPAVSGRGYEVPADFASSTFMPGASTGSLVH